MTDTRAGTRGGTAEKPFELTFPRGREEDRDQDEEFCELVIDGETRRIRFHDYDEIFQIPGLYEQLFYTELECDSPRTIAGLIGEQVDNESAAELRVLDVGAGNGMVGEELDRMGAEHIVGVDIIPEAAEAARARSSRDLRRLLRRGPDRPSPPTSWRGWRTTASTA